MPSPPNNPKRSPHSPAAPQQFELIDPRWLLKALGITFAIALLCTCATLIWIHHWKLSHPAPVHPAATKRNL